MQLDFINTINKINQFYREESRTIHVLGDFSTPGFWVVLAAYAKLKRIEKGSISFENKRLESYATAIGLSKALWDSDNFRHDRKNEGLNYSSLECLDRPESTDKATSCINSCVRKMFSAVEVPDTFVSQACDVIGDVHDNVWSHGMASGFSVAQKWPVNHHDDSDYWFEFALADSGIGLLGEIKRCGLKDIANNHREAIEWCIQEGNSTKKPCPQDDWSQTMPADISNNPLRGIEKTNFSNGSHHQGLGLSKLVRFVDAAGGQLWLASGDCALQRSFNGQRSYMTLTSLWSGVALACRFRWSVIKNNFKPIHPSSRVEQIKQQLLKGGRHE